MTTLKLISTARLSNLLQVDATFKLNWNDLPVLIFGSSDGNRRFHPYGMATIRTDEGASSYITLFQTIKECVYNVTSKIIYISLLVSKIPCVRSIQYDFQYLMGDGAMKITASKNFEFPHCRRLMCWAHIILKMREHRKMEFGGERDISHQLFIKICPRRCSLRFPDI